MLQLAFTYGSKYVNHKFDVIKNNFIVEIIFHHKPHFRLLK